jgi:hypothetical protein
VSSHRERRRLFSVVESELAVLDRALVEGEPAEALRRWIARALVDLRREIAELRSLGLGGVDRASEEDSRLEAASAAARAVGVDVPAPERPSWHSRTPPPRARRPSAKEERDQLAKERGVDLRAPAEEVKRRLRGRAREAHPDFGGTHERMVKVNRLRELVTTVP